MTERPDQLTILFTDVEGSTDLSARAGDTIAQELLQAHESVVRTAVAEHGGREVKSLGDGFLLAFPTPAAGLQCAVAIQRRLAEANGAGLAVRMGLNTGEVVERDRDLFGVTVNVAARVMGKARGGQILVAPSVRDQLENGHALVDRGLFWLKGVPERVRLYEVDWGGTRASASGRSAFVGREAELADFRRLLEDAVAGHGAVAVVGGEPGVGKTRLAQEVADEATRLGMRVLLGHCDESEAGTPYLPVVEIVEAAARDVAPEELRAALSESAAEVARLTPEIRRLFPDLPSPLDLPPEQARRYLFNCVREFLDRAARTRPLLLILDDLHWADEATLLLLQHLAEGVADSPALIVGTYRDVELDVTRPLARTIEELVRRRLVHRVSLKRMASDDVRALLDALSGQTPPAALVQAVYAETEGNPFFVEEVYRHLAESGRLFDDRGAFRTDLHIDELDVPESVRLVIGRRLERLTESARDALAAAAIVGRRFEFDLLEAVAGGDDPDALVDAVDEAERARVIAQDADASAPSFQFVHELIRQTLLSGLSVVRRQRLHAKAADAIERVHPDRLDDHAADIAHHLLRAGSAGRPADAARYLLIAGKRALDAAAFEEALRHFDNATAMADALTPADHAELLYRQGLAQRSVGRWEEAIQLWDQAVDELEALGDRQAVGAVCYNAAYQLAWGARFEDALVITGRGLAAVEGLDIRERALLLGSGGLMFGSGGYYDAAHQMIDEGLDLGDRIGDRHVRGEVLALKSIVRWEYLEFDEAIRLGLEAADLLREAGDLFEQANVLSFVTMSYSMTGRHQETERLVAEVGPQAERVGHVGAEMTVHRMEAATIWMTSGDLDAYEPHGRRDLQLNEAADLPWIAESYVFLGMLASFRGERDQATELLEEAVRREQAAMTIGWHRGALFAHLARYGDRDRALAIVDDPSAPMPLPGQPNTTGSWSMLYSAIVGLAELGERERVAGLYPLAEEAVDRGILLEPILFRLSHTVAGIAAAAGERWQEAERHFAAAEEQAERLRLRFEQADLLRFRAMFHMWRAGDNDRESVLALLELAMAQYEAMGMPRHVEICRELMGVAGP